MWNSESPITFREQIYLIPLLARRIKQEHMWNCFHARPTFFSSSVGSWILFHFCVCFSRLSLSTYLNPMHLRRFWTSELQFSRFFHSALNYTCSRITFTKSRSSCMTTCSASLQNLMSSYLVHVISTDKYWKPPPPDYKNTPFNSHMTSCTLQTCDISLGSLWLPAPNSVDFVELILLYICILYTTKNSSCIPLRTDMFVIPTDDWS
jgi:hypothetical protein